MFTPMWFATVAVHPVLYRADVIGLDSCVRTGVGIPSISSIFLLVPEWLYNPISLLTTAFYEYFFNVSWNNKQQGLLIDLVLCDFLDYGTLFKIENFICYKWSFLLYIIDAKKLNFKCLKFIFCAFITL